MIFKPHNKKLLIFSAIILIVGLVFLIFLRKDEDAWIKDKGGNWVMHGNPAIHDFESCVTKNAMIDGIPRRCVMPKGPTFSEDYEKVVVYGDSRDGDDVHRKIVSQITKADPVKVFHTGDMVNDGNNTALWQEFDQITAPIFERLFPALGNHEKNSSNYYDNFTLPNNERWYSIKTDYIYFIVLDSNIAFSEGSEQMLWLASELARAKESDKFIAVVLHHPPYSSSKHANDSNTLKIQSDLVPVLERNGVSIVLSGHDHVYERLEKSGIAYIIAGASGAPLYEKTQSSEYEKFFVSKNNFVLLNASKSLIQMQAFDENGELVDSSEIRK